MSGPQRAEQTWNSGRLLEFASSKAHCTASSHWRARFCTCSALRALTSASSAACCRTHSLHLTAFPWSFSCGFFCLALMTLNSSCCFFTLHRLQLHIPAVRPPNRHSVQTMFGDPLGNSHLSAAKLAQFFSFLHFSHLFRSQSWHTACPSSTRRIAAEKPLGTFFFLHLQHFFVTHCLHLRTPSAFFHSSSEKYCGPPRLAQSLLPQRLPPSHSRQIL